MSTGDNRSKKGSVGCLPSVVRQGLPWDVLVDVLRGICASRRRFVEIDGRSVQSPGDHTAFLLFFFFFFPSSLLASLLVLLRRPELNYKSRTGLAKESKKTSNKMQVVAKGGTDGIPADLFRISRERSEPAAEEKNGMRRDGEYQVSKKRNSIENSSASPGRNQRKKEEKRREDCETKQQRMREEQDR